MHSLSTLSLITKRILTSWIKNCNYIQTLYYIFILRYFHTKAFIPPPPPLSPSAMSNRINKAYLFIINLYSVSKLFENNKRTIKAFCWMPNMAIPNTKTMTQESWNLKFVLFDLYSFILSALRPGVVRIFRETM